MCKSNIHRFLFVGLILFFKIHAMEKPKNYSEDIAIIRKLDPNTIEIKDSSDMSLLAISPALQGRVMTSTANGNNGYSFGWINYKLIESGKTQSHINAYGGEERIWFGPEGGQFSFYFTKGNEFVFDNWQVPPVIDTEPFNIVEVNKQYVQFNKTTKLFNYSGFRFDIKIDRKIELISREEAEKELGIQIPNSIQMVAYQSENTITNIGEQPWDNISGMPSIWMLCMFKPSENAIVLIPYNNNESITDPIVNDNYFGKIPVERLSLKKSHLEFKVDGKYRSKIGLQQSRATDRLGAWDQINNTYTLLQYNKPTIPLPYVNSKWEIQNNPFSGDVINAYNDGPLANGEQMGPFFELESSSPVANLLPHQSITHLQRIYHFIGNHDEIEIIINKTLNLNQ